MGNGGGFRGVGRAQRGEGLAGLTGDFLQAAFQTLVAVVVTGGCPYYALVLAAARSFLARCARRRPPTSASLSFSVLKPLAGDEPGLQENLRGFFQLDEPKYELLCAARDADDPALTRAESLARLYPAVRLRALVVLAVGGLVLRDRLVVQCCWLVPVQDVLSAALWPPDSSTIESFGGRRHTR